MHINPEAGRPAAFMKFDMEMFWRRAEALRFIEQRQHQRRHQQADIPLRPEREQRLLFPRQRRLMTIDMIGPWPAGSARRWLDHSASVNACRGGFVKSQEIEQVWAQGGDFFPNTLRRGMLSRRQRSPPDKFIAESEGNAVPFDFQIQI